MYVKNRKSYLKEARGRGMKRLNFKQLFELGLFSILIGSFGYKIIYGEVKQLNFDSLYPKSWYAKATENCVQVWGTLDQLSQKKITVARQSFQYIDRAIGQLVFAQSCLEHMTRGKSQPSVENIHYLSRVVGTIADRYHRLPQIDEDRLDCLKNRILKVQKKVEQLLPKDQSLATGAQ